MTDVVPLEPRYGKRDTLLALQSKRAEIRSVGNELQELQAKHAKLHDEANELEKEASEWMRRDKTQTEVVMKNWKTSTSTETVAIVFTCNQFGRVDCVAVHTL